MMKKTAYVSKEDIQQIEDTVYLVPSEGNVGTHHRVDTQLCMCDCVHNLRGHFCKHLFAVTFFFKINNTECNLPPISAEDRRSIAYIALGKAAPELEFFSPLHTNSIGNKNSTFR